MDTIYYFVIFLLLFLIIVNPESLVGWALLFIILAYLVHERGWLSSSKPRTLETFENEPFEGTRVANLMGTETETSIDLTPNPYGPLLEPLVEERYKEIGEEKLRVLKPQPTITNVYVPKELDNSDTIDRMFDQKRDMNDELVAMNLELGRHFKEAKDRNIRSNIEVYNTWWLRELEDSEARDWWEVDQGRYFTDSIAEPETLRSWVETGYMVNDNSG